MNNAVKPERVTQKRIVKLFRGELGYSYLGNWEHRPNNSNIEEDYLKSYLLRQHYSDEQINIALHQLHSEADKVGRTLYGNNQAVYTLLRYGISIKTQASDVTETVHLINWSVPEANDFAIAEEVTLLGRHERRPDIVLYINGIAIGILELKNSRVSLTDGIYQNLSNQQSTFNEWFFSTVQILFAGNDSEGLKYGTTGTEAKYWLTWKEDEADNSRYLLDKYLLKICNKSRLIELIHDFILFDGGTKKLPRVHQYFSIKAAQQHIQRRQGGIIWHTQGSGKSIVMVLLAKWILENLPQARVAIITDRDELDKQIKNVFTDAGETIYRTNSGRDLMAQLGQASPRLLCSLIHKFGRKNIGDFESFIQELATQPSPTYGEIFVFVDECHRTQSGKLNRLMKALMPNAIFIGFTGTPLLKKDKASTMEVFGDYIHTYKFNEAVEDKVVLDLIYEARDIDQRLGSQEKIDLWFDAKTKPLNHWQKDELKKYWGTLQKVLSSRSRMDRIVSEIIFDFTTKTRLETQRGNAILVASSIYEACKYFTLFQKTPFKGQCAIITSYNPQTRHITLEETGTNSETDKQFIYNTYQELLQDVVPIAGSSKAESYEEWAKSLFIREPANMKLLIVVEKLLTGFDAPSCTYLYIDKSMQDHALFQAICRTNRLDGEDKDFGFIIDYKDLFKKVEKAIAVYSSELDHSVKGSSPEVMMQQRISKGKERLDETMEHLALLCEPVAPPKEALNFIHYFCGNVEIPTDLAEHEPQRVAFYKTTANFMRAYANIADEMLSAGYTADDINYIKAQQKYYLGLREIIRKASGESLDLKSYEADMRHLIDTYIEAEQPKKISLFNNLGLLDLIIKTGITDAINSQLNDIKDNHDTVAETIENNVRKKIIQEQAADPVYYEKMSMLLDEVIRLRKNRALEYEEYLKQINELITKVQTGTTENTPEQLHTQGARAIYRKLKITDDSQVDEHALQSALCIHSAIKRASPDDWRGNLAREQVVKRTLYEIVQDKQIVEQLFLIIYAQREY